MAKMTFKAGDEYALNLSRLLDSNEEITKKAIYAASDMVADKIRSNIEALPEDTFRHLDEGEQFNGVPENQKKDMLNSLGVTPIKADYNGDYNAKIGFDGYGEQPTKKYPQGVPNQLLARSVESGSSVRKKTPFVRPAVNSVKKKAVAAMNEVINNEIAKVMGNK